MVQLSSFIDAAIRIAVYSFERFGKGLLKPRFPMFKVIQNVFYRVITVLGERLNKRLKGVNGCRRGVTPLRNWTLIER